MDKHALDTFRARVRKVSLPEDVRESVIDELRIEKGDRARSPRRPRRARQGLTRRTFVRAGAVAAGGVAAFLGANALMNHLDNRDGNWFALTAYADGTDDGSGSRLALGEKFGGHIGWAGGVDPETDVNLLMLSTQLVLTCTGGGVDTLTYSLEGENVLAGLPASDAYISPGIWIQWATTYQPGEISSGPVESFTVDYENQNPNGLLDALAGTNAAYSVYANVPMPDDLAPVFLELDEISEAENERAEGDGEARELQYTEEEEARQMELHHQVSLRAAELFAEELAKVTLVMTAAFTDGTEQTKRYAFLPREDYVQVYDEYLTADDEAVLAGDDARRTELINNPPSLYLITETEG